MEQLQNYRTGGNIAKMWLYTIIGIAYFMLPFKVNGETTMAISFLEGFILDNISIMSDIIIHLIIATSIISIVVSLGFKGKIKNQFAAKIFETGILGMLWRLVGALIIIMVRYEIGPDMIIGGATGGLVVLELIPMLCMLFLFALPLIGILTDFGTLDLIGGILAPLFKPLFKLSGKASVLSIVSYVGSGTTGMLVTDGAHKRGELTTKEANIIVLGFAILSFPVTFAYPTGIAGMDVQNFPALAGCLVLCTIVCNIILCRIPPISKKPNTYFDGSEYIEEGKIEGRSRLSVAYENALKRAASADSFGKMLKKGMGEFVDFVIAVFPMIVTIATVVLVIAEFTSVFGIIATPIAPILSMAGLPEAAAAAPGFVLGFADIFLPFITASTVESQLTKFVLCAVGIMQIYCMSEGGAILLKSSMKINFGNLVAVFLMRTIIAFPIALLIGKLIGLQ